MARKKTAHFPHLPYHLYNRTLDRSFYPADLDEIWHNCLDILRRCRKIYPIHVHAFVLMGNHYHMIASCDAGKLYRLGQYFQSNISRYLTDTYSTRQYRFERRYGRTVISLPSGYLNVLRYVAQNPSRAGIVERFDEYPFSSFSRTLREPDNALFEPHPFQEPVLAESLTSWLAHPTSTTETESVRNGLRGTDFGETSVSRSSRRVRKTENLTHLRNQKASDA